MLSSQDHQLNTHVFSKCLFLLDPLDSPAEIYLLLLL